MNRSRWILHTGRAGAAAVLALSSAAAARAESGCDAVALAALPLVERAATTDTNPTLVVLLTGDGGWARADDQVSDGLRARGAAVVGIRMSAYLGTRRTPDEAAADIECVARAYLARWHRDRVMVVGYSRGADIGPFVVSRWPADLRGRVNMVALVSLGTRANFQFHTIDLIRDVRRDDDLPVAAELAKLRGMRLVCVYGSDERDSGCRSADSTLITRFERAGGHRLTGGFEAVVGILAPGLRP